MKCWDLEFTCDVGVITHSPAFLQLLRIGAPLAIDDPDNVWWLPSAPTCWANAVLVIRPELSAVSRELADHGAYFRLQLPKALLVPCEPLHQLFYLHEDVWEPSVWAAPSLWGPFPEPSSQLKNAWKFVLEVGVIANSPAFLHLLRMHWDG